MIDVKICGSKHDLTDCVSCQHVTGVMNGGGRDSNTFYELLLDCHDVCALLTVAVYEHIFIQLIVVCMCPDHPTEVDKERMEKFENVLSLIHTLYSVTKWMSIFYL